MKSKLNKLTPFNSLTKLTSNYPKLIYHHNSAPEQQPSATPSQLSPPHIHPCREPFEHSLTTTVSRFRRN
ncbi:hypothetical protein Hdeb2414_s0070g00772531 [Helianthus debilis subsp. tardiflorus]